MGKSYYKLSFVWGMIAKGVDAFAKFFTTPLLLTHFGVNDFGILTLVLSTNAYMQLLDMGINTGAIKYFSDWIEKGRKNLLTSVVGTSLSFYLIIGVLNSLVLIGLSVFSHQVFGLEGENLELFQSLMLILSCFTIFSWVGSVMNQLLIANEEISISQKLSFFKTVAFIALISIVYYFELSLYIYLPSLLAINFLLVVLPSFLILKKRNLVFSFLPRLDWKNFKIVLSYSLGIFAMGIFQFTANKSRPIILALDNTDTLILTEYTILEVFPLFIISIGGMAISIFLPKASKLLVKGDRDQLNKFVYEGTSLTTVLVLLLCMPIILNSYELIEIYVGEKYTYLGGWLALWVFTILMYLYNSPVSSLVLASGKTKALVVSSAISSIASIIINYYLKDFYGVGSSVIGYAVYIFIQMSFYYLYFYKHLLGLSSLKVFLSFIKPTLIALIYAALVYFALPYESLFESAIIPIIIKSLVWSILFLPSLFLLKILDYSVLKSKVFK